MNAGHQIDLGFFAVVRAPIAEHHRFRAGKLNLAVDEGVADNGYVLVGVDFEIAEIAEYAEVPVAQVR